MIDRYEIASVEGVGYLLFAIAENGKQKRIGNIYDSVAEAQSNILPTRTNRVDLVNHSAARNITVPPRVSLQSMQPHSLHPVVNR